ncbi:hypothetical protein EIK77_007711 [Talaromyces pinophilus]|nr:hypothetical protein EIK77_007711 [Talaromyces pinophilus]
MGTRNLICIWYKGRFMVAQYCQWDGYLEGQGAKILKFLLVPGNIERLKKGLTRITPVDDQTVQDILDKHSYSTFKNNKKVCECGSAVSFQEPEKCFPSTLNRDTGAKILDIIAAARPDDYIPIQLSLDFAANGLFCEFCYCVDLDAEVFEVFGDAVTIPPTTGDGNEKIEQIGKNRFVEVCRVAEPAPLMGKSMPRLLKSWPLDQLPKDLDDMLAQVAADNVGESEYEDGEHEDLEDDVDDDESEADDDAKEVVKDVDQEDDTKDNDRKPDNEDKPADDGDDDKNTTNDDAQNPANEDQKAVIPDEYDPLIEEEKKIFKDEKERAEYKKRIDQIAEDMIIEAEQLSLRRERERAAMQQAGTAGGKERTFTLSIRETK